MHFRFRWLASASLLIGSALVAAQAAEADRALLEAEETYELRLDRVNRSKGAKAVVEMLTRDLAARPRPYVKAWYAHYLIYGEAFGLKDFADPKQGFALAKESAAEGSLFGLELVGRAYGDGRGPGYRDTTDALKYLNEAATKGRDTAFSELAPFYFFGINVPQDRTKAEELARRAACQGATAGLFRLALWWDDPKYAGTADHPKALALYYEAAEFGDRHAREVVRNRVAAGDPLAEKYEKLAVIVNALEGSGEYPSQVRKTVRWLEEHAAADDVPVQLALAELMIEKTGPVYDAKAARQKLERAAAAGSDDARTVLATMAWRGIGQKADPAAAIGSLQELASRKNARALNFLGWLSWWGNGEKFGVKKDAAAAFTRCHEAADLGYWQAQENLADCYAHGIGTEVNYYLAAKYYQILEQRGFTRGRDMKQRMLAEVKD